MTYLLVCDSSMNVQLTYKHQLMSEYFRLPHFQPPFHEIFHFFKFELTLLILIIMDQKKMLNDTLEQQRTPTHWRQASSAQFTGPLLSRGVADFFCWQINRPVRGQRREGRPGHTNAAQSYWQARVKSVTYQLLLDCTLISLARILSCDSKLN